MQHDDRPETVKRADLFGNVTNTHQTEGEVNGWRERQYVLFDRESSKQYSKSLEHPRKLV